MYLLERKLVFIQEDGHKDDSFFEVCKYFVYIFLLEVFLSPNSNYEALMSFNSVYQNVLV